MQNLFDLILRGFFNMDQLPGRFRFLQSGRAFAIMCRRLPPDRKGLSAGQKTRFSEGISFFRWKGSARFNGSGHWIRTGIGDRKRFKQLEGE